METAVSRHDSPFLYNEAMSGNLLQTKLYVPQRPRDANGTSRAPRLRLIENLNAGLDGKLTLISAPAGFGKTTLVSEWIAGGKRPFAWLSLDERDSDLTRFLAYLIAAIQTVSPTTGEQASAMLGSPEPPPPEALLTTLLNEIATISEAFALVLDDYHVVNAQPIDQAIAFLLENLPPQMHLVITTREDPPLPLPRLRVRGQLTEIRASDLRFTVEEAAVFLNRIMGIDLSAEDIATLETRTEGWIAGLQLAAISIQGQADVQGFIKKFAGDNRYIVDYLIEEVLQCQPETVRSFLLQTSILYRLTGALCDAVRFGDPETPIGQEDGKEMLKTLERGGLFVVPLDDRRQWYRYHHLFADVLRARLLAEKPNQVPDLHRRASWWYEQHNYPYDAIHHAFAAEDFARAAKLVQQAWPVLRQNYSDTTLLRWVRRLPDELLRARPVLSVYYADALLSSEPNTAEAYLRNAERWLDTHTSLMIDPQTAVVTEAELRSLPGMIAFIRAYQASARRNLAGTVKYAQRALALLPEGNYLYRGSASVLLGLAQWTGGELAAARRSITDSLSSMQRSGNISAVIGTTYLLADVQMAQGHLHQAKSTIQQALKRATDYGKPKPQGTSDLHVLLSELHREQGDLEMATQHLQTSQELGEHAALLVTRYRWYVAMARIKEAAGDLDNALDLLAEAERLQIGGPTPDVQPIAALRANTWIRQGRLAEARAWLRAQNVPSDDELHYLGEFTQMTLARLLIAEYQREGERWLIDDAARLLVRLLNAAESGGRIGSLIEILILQALVHYAQGDVAAALAPLQRALQLAAPEMYVQCFVNEGVPMARLLQEAISREVGTEYGRKLLTAFPPAKSQQTERYPLPKPHLAEPLSEREIEVLEYIARGFTNQEIADQLILSLYTIKAHARNIYGKLDVSNRTEAVTKARALGILPQS